MCLFWIFFLLLFFYFIFFTSKVELLRNNISAADCSFSRPGFMSAEIPPLGAYLCWAPPASPQHVQTPQWLSARVCWEAKRLGERRVFCLVCPASSPPLCNPEPGPSEMSGGGIGHDTLPFLQSLESQWKDFVGDKQPLYQEETETRTQCCPFLVPSVFVQSAECIKQKELKNIIQRQTKILETRPDFKCKATFFVSVRTMSPVINLRKCHWRTITIQNKDLKNSRSPLFT